MFKNPLQEIIWLIYLLIMIVCNGFGMHAAALIMLIVIIIRQSVYGLYQWRNTVKNKRNYHGDNSK